jgi:hypothetical protein
MVLTVILGALLAAWSGLCILMPHRIAAYARERYSRLPKWMQDWPFADLVLKPWYPTYLRITGIAGVLCATAWTVLALKMLP